MTTHFRMPAANGLGIKLQQYGKEKFLIKEGLHPETLLNNCATFSYQDGDILICAYPKCGNHWMDNMVWKLKTMSDYKRPKFTVVENGENECYVDQETPRILHSHFRVNRLPKEHLENNGKIIIIARNPKDACVSFYHHLKDAAYFKNGQTFDEYFESYFFGRVMLRSYFGYLEEWEDILSKGTYPNIKIFYYEDCKENPMEALVRLNKFLGFKRDQDYLDKVLEETGFEAMKRSETQDKSRINMFCLDTEGNTVIYRKGVVGDWKNQFTVTQSERVDALLKQKLTKGIFDFGKYT